MGNCYSKNYKTELVNYEYADLLIDHFISLCITQYGKRYMFKVEEIERVRIESKNLVRKYEKIDRSFVIQLCLSIFDPKYIINKRMIEIYMNVDLSIHIYKF
jgi:hypothetical protein